MFKYPRRRLYRLSPWLIRALIPAAHIGTYALFKYASKGIKLIYIGRSDTCLRRRLISHAQRNRAEYFDYDIQWTPQKAFIAECAAYHALAHTTTNVIHPASPRRLAMRCPFCQGVFDQIRQNRLNGSHF
jgi:hypothetical protein